MKSTKTLGEFIIKNRKDFPYAKGELSALLSSIRLAAKFVHCEINRAGLSAIRGKLDEENIQGEQQARLDLMANQVFIETLRSRGEVCGVASEEMEDYLAFGEEINEHAKYIVLIDPLDGSSNIDVNICVGSIFSIYKRLSQEGGPIELKDFLQPGINQVAAGYVIYGTSTMLVYTTGNGVNGFTYDPGIGSFLLSHPKIKFPKQDLYYSINEGNYIYFNLGIKRFIKWLQEEEPQSGRPYSSRYTGSLVADFHRNMLLGGIFLYPEGTMAPMGKLRLLYECNPMAFITEQAGGKCSNGYLRIMELNPLQLHQRTPFICGSKGLVDKVEELLYQEYQTRIHSNF